MNAKLTISQAVQLSRDIRDGKVVPVVEEDNIISKTPKPIKDDEGRTRGQLYKLKHGISKSMKRNMTKKGVLDMTNIPGSLTVYKKLRKDVFKLRKKAIRNKHETAKANRKSPKDRSAAKSKNKQDSTTSKHK